MMLTAILATQTTERIMPAFRAYSEPSPEGFQFPESGAIKGWSSTKNHLVWFVKFRSAGEVHVSLYGKDLPTGNGTFKLKVSNKSGQIASGDSNGSDTSLDFGTFNVRKEGYVRFELSALSASSSVQIGGLKLAGAPVATALINETKYRSSASVHVRWPAPRNAPITWFYNEIVPKSSPLSTYYMACGWSRGYFGIQVNSPTERRVIFSVWDSGKEKVTRDKVDKELQVQLVEKGPGVFTGSFGNEGTGGHSHLLYSWKTDSVQRFLVRAKPIGTKTIYSGYYYFNDRKSWGLISSWSAPQDGKYLGSLYSFIEDFWGGEGQKQRLADFGPAWIKAGSDWSQVTNGSFTHTARMPNYREDYYYKVSGSRVTASAGGYTNEGPVTYGENFSGIKPSRPPSNDVLNWIRSVEEKDKE